MAKRVSILGCTGSIGRSTLDVIRKNPDDFEVAVLAARGNVGLLRAQIEEFNPDVVVLHCVDAAAELRKDMPPCKVWSGLEGLKDAAAIPVDIVVCAVVGAVGIHPLLAAIGAGNRVAIANKEPLVMAGKYVMEEARRRDVEVLPIDSEHSAIFQCLQGARFADIRCVHLTASGGPFYGRSIEDLRHISPSEAMSHPTWDMGVKISVDSATLMNKGLEIIEAIWLFGLGSEQIQVVIHPQSIVHSLVEFIDGSILAQLGVTDMRVPILFALSYPERFSTPDMRLDLTSLSTLSFSEPDCDAFPCLALARSAADIGGTAPAILNAANEVAVELFCAGKLSFTGIPEVVGKTLEQCPSSAEYGLSAVLDADHEARHYARSLIETME